MPGDTVKVDTGFTNSVTQTLYNSQGPRKSKPFGNTLREALCCQFDWETRSDACNCESSTPRLSFLLSKNLESYSDTSKVTAPIPLDAPVHASSPGD